MRVNRALSITLLVLLATPWAALLSIGGIWILAFGPSLWPSAADLARVSGITMIAAGQLVFLVCIADRVFPLGARRIAAWVELPICVVILGGCIGMLWLVLEGLWRFSA